jgi:hypothetical protein
VGATIVHRILARLFEDRGMVLDRTYQALAKANTGSQQKREGAPAGPLTGTGLHKSP